MKRNSMFAVVVVVAAGAMWSVSGQLSPSDAAEKEPLESLQPAQLHIQLRGVST